MEMNVAVPRILFDMDSQLASQQNLFIHNEKQQGRDE